MRKNLTLLLFLLTGSLIYAGGYRVALQGQKQLAMGHTGVAVISSAESLFFNPAGLSYLDGKLNVSLGGTAVFTDTKFQSLTDNYSTETQSPTGTPINFYGSYKINDWLTFGIGVYTPYGSKVEWNQDWAGSHLVNNINLKAIFVQPTLAIKVNDYLSIGGGPIYVNGSVNFNRNLNTGSSSVNSGGRSNVTIDKKGITAWGYNVGIMVKPMEKLNIGFNYRSKIVMDAKGGDADFENIAILPDGKFDAELPLPAEASIGISYELCDHLLFAFDYNFTKWSAYEALVVRFDNAAGVSTNLRNYKDTDTFRFGVQYKAHKKFTLEVVFILMNHLCKMDILHLKHHVMTL